MDNRISDSELLFLIAQGNLEAKKLLDKRYFNYCKTITKTFLDSHPDYGYSFDDFFNAAMLGYCRARNKFDYEVSDGFYPYFKIWAESEMKDLMQEGTKFFLNENPKKFVSLDITYKSPEDPISLSETFGNDDYMLSRNIKSHEVYSLLTDSKIGLTEKEIIIFAGLLMKRTSTEMREELKLTYGEYRTIIKAIKNKIGQRLSDIFK